MAKDPVCGMKIEEDDAEATSEYEGQEYYFCSQECKEEFDKDPELYAEKKTGGAGGD
ncbi:MAG: YHS domain-containing protein [Rhodospirillales bacterium]